MPSELRQACAAIAFDKQQSALSDAEPTFLIMNHLWDETRFNVYVPQQPVSQYPMLNQHALLTWKSDEQADPTSQELFVPSSVLYSNNASCMYAAMQKSRPFDLVQLLQMAATCATWIVTADAFPANMMLF